MDTPDKIYLTLGENEAFVFTQKRSDNLGIEYTRTDVLIEKVLDFFENDLCCYIGAQEFTIDNGRLEKDFRKLLEE